MTPIRIAINRSLSLSALRTMERTTGMSSASTPRPSANVIIFSVMVRTNCGGRIDRNAAVAALLGPPGSVRIEILERESDRIHQLVAARAGLILAMQGHLFAQGHDLLAGVAVFERRNVRWRLRRRRA